MTKKPIMPGRLRKKAQMQLVRSLQRSGPAPAEEILHEASGVSGRNWRCRTRSCGRRRLNWKSFSRPIRDFYDSPPSAISPSPRGHDRRYHLTGAKLLGMERSKLLHRRFVPLHCPRRCDRWHHHFLSVLNTTIIWIVNYCSSVTMEQILWAIALPAPEW